MDEVSKKKRRGPVAFFRDKFREIALKAKQNKFLFSELVKRDFKKKYKRTVLGMFWSILSPLLSLLVMRLVFTQFFGRNTQFYTTYLFCGTLVFSFFTDATNGGMSSLMSNASIFSKINVPKYLFLFSKTVSSLINFGLTFCVFLIFCAIDGVPFTWNFFLLIIPIICLTLFNIGIGLILSALFIFFRDIQYLWSVFLTLIQYLSAIFYNPDQFGAYSKLFLLNPVYVYIKYFRLITIGNGTGNYVSTIPSIQYHFLMLGYALVALMIGALIYKKNNHKFLYYV